MIEINGETPWVALMVSVIAICATVWLCHSCSVMEQAEHVTETEAIKAGLEQFETTNGRVIWVKPRTNHYE